MTEENKTIARKVYEIISTGDFDWAEEIIDASAPEIELLPGQSLAKLLDTFKETFAKDREGFPDFSVVEDVMAAEQVL